MEYQLATSGVVVMCPPAQPSFAYLKFDDLDSFTQGYIEALFFTEGKEPGIFENPDGGMDVAKGFEDLAPEALEAIIEDCRKFQAANEGTLLRLARLGPMPYQATTPLVRRFAGRDFLYTRNGHGCGFWDGDWPEPYASALAKAADAFDQVDAYLGDDGKVYLG